MTRPARLEHVNITVSDVAATARWLGAVFGWRVRWEGPSLNDGFTAHVGEDETYVALYAPPQTADRTDVPFATLGGLNHVGVVVDEALDAVEARVKAAGFAPHSHADYEPGRRFYFDDADGIEWEVVSYR